jgi:hypothetical protein
MFIILKLQPNQTSAQPLDFFVVAELFALGKHVNAHCTVCWSTINACSWVLRTVIRVFGVFTIISTTITWLIRIECNKVFRKNVENLIKFKK